FAGYFRRHAHSRLNKRADLQRRGRGEEESATRDVDGFGKMIAFVRGKINGAETEWRAGILARQLTTFGLIHGSLFHARKNPRSRKLEKGLQAIRPAISVK